MPSPLNHLYSFGEFTLDTGQRVLLREGKPVPVTPKVFDTLLILVENSGRILSKDELMNRLWPDTFVEQTNLSFNIKQLRKSFGDDARNPAYIETINRRGYRFIAKVDTLLNDGNPEYDQTAGQPASSESLERQRDPGLGSPGRNDSSTSTLEIELDTSGDSIHAVRILHPASTGTRRRSIAFRAALVTVLTAGLVIFLRFSNGRAQNSSETAGAAGSAWAASTLKLEMLTATGQSGLVALSPDGKYIAYTRHFGQKSSIWLSQLATGANVEVVPAGGVIHGLAFANSGESLYFVRCEPARVLYHVPVLGGAAIKIVDELEGNFSLSSDDSQIAFIRKVIRPDRPPEFCLNTVGSDGTGERTVLAQTYPVKLNVPVWSPGNQSIICSLGANSQGGQEVAVVEVSVADGRKRVLSPERFSNISKIAWLPQFTGLIITASKRLEDTNHLWQLSYPGGEAIRLSDGLGSYLDLSIASHADKAAASQVSRISDMWVGPAGEPHKLKKITQASNSFCWLPDGRLVYSSMTAGTEQLWTMRADGSEQRQLTNDRFAKGSPAVTPDGRYVVFVSNRSGVFQVWRMDIGGGNLVQLTDGGGKNFPAVSPDGKWVLYNTIADWSLWKVPIDGGEPVRLTDYIATHPCVSPDGKSIACMGGNESKGQLLVAPFEGGQPLRNLELAGWNSRVQWTTDGKAILYVAYHDGIGRIVKQSLDGSPANEVMSFGEDEAFDFGCSFDGQSLAVTRGAWRHDIVLINDLQRGD
jgi:Tol biopolymer transport system component/DNA-binding winged helix-turn-helix (wHTH) protein